MKKRHSLKDKRILITSGPTWVAIDDVRVIANRSTGRLGRALCEELLKERARITLLEGPVASPFRDKKVKVRNFKFYDELQRLLNRELAKKYDVIIHAAAVSDFRPQRPVKGKIASDNKRWALKLVATKKLVNLLRAKAKKAVLVGFKLEPRLSRPHAAVLTRSLFHVARCDLVVANSIGRGGYKGFIVNKAGHVTAGSTSRERLSRRLLKEIRKLL